MSKILLREEAVKLRLRGYTYGQIKHELGVTKSTLSGWLQKLPLTSEQIKILSQNREKTKELGREKFRITYQNKRLERLKTVYDSQLRKLLPLSKKELFLAGVFLYWGEGEKTHGIISVSNTDPKVVKFAYCWMTRSLKIPKLKIKVQLHLYKDMDINESINFWSRFLGISKEQFYKPYIKKTNRAGLTYKSFGYGTCKILCSNTSLSEEVAMSIKAISDRYGAKSKTFWYN